MSMSNRHPVDALADVREQIKKLQDEEAVLKETILENGDYVGDEFLAQATEQSRSSLDRAACEKKFSKAELADCMKSSSFVVLKVLRKASPKGQAFD